MKSTKKILLVIEVVIIALIVSILLISILSTKSRTFNLGKTANIKDENISITVLSSEKVSIDDEYGILSETGDYIKVKVSIQNNGSNEYSWSNFSSFKLGDKFVAFSTHDDDLPNKIAASSIETGYLYFEYTDEKVMQYTNSITSSKASKYYFKIN